MSPHFLTRVIYNAKLAVKLWDFLFAFLTKNVFIEPNLEKKWDLIKKKHLLFFLYLKSLLNDVCDPLILL